VPAPGLSQDEALELIELLAGKRSSQVHVLGLASPLRAPPYPQLNRKDLLGGLIHEYEPAA
jgi:hypothetical protein